MRFIYYYAFFMSKSILLISALEQLFKLLFIT